MAHVKKSTHTQWSSRWIFILAATGSAVGLGNIWKFPYITGENGGAAFVLVYLFFVLAIGVPVLIAEIMIGRRGRHNPPDALNALAEESNRSKFWSISGWLGLGAGFLILSYYVVIAGWSVDYIIHSAAGDFKNATAGQIKSLFDALMASPIRLTLFGTAVLVGTMFIIARGLKRGLELAIRFMFPMMLIILLVLVGYSIGTGNFMLGVRYLFEPDFSKLSAMGILAALGHALFTLSLGQGALMMYGAYVPKHIPIAKVSVIIAAADTVVALLAGLAIFPIVLAYQLEPAAGPGLIFQTLPIAFGQMPFGTLFAVLFFIMVLFAAFTSAIALIEPTVAWLIEHTHMSRIKASTLTGIALWILSLGTVLSFNYWQNVTFFGLDFFNFIDHLTANLMLPLGALFSALFVGWRMYKQAIFDELDAINNTKFKLWYFAIRYLAPIGILFIFLNAFELIDPLLKLFN